MNFKEYQEGTTKTFKEHVVLSAHHARLLDWIIGLNGEVGEVSELIKHMVFHGEPVDKMEMAKEIGDILWYVSALCKTLDLPMEKVAELNIAKLQHRHGQKFNKNGSKDRHKKEEAFSDTPLYKLLEQEIYQGCGCNGDYMKGKDLDALLDGAVQLNKEFDKYREMIEFEKYSQQVPKHIMEKEDR